MDGVRDYDPGITVVIFIARCNAERGYATAKSVCPFLTFLT